MVPPRYVLGLLAAFLIGIALFATIPYIDTAATYTPPTLTALVPTDEPVPATVAPTPPLRRTHGPREATTGTADAEPPQRLSG